MNSGPRWLISITDWPEPPQSSISAAACLRTSSGRVAGPALKLKTRDTGPNLAVRGPGAQTRPGHRSVPAAKTGTRTSRLWASTAGASSSAVLVEGLEVVVQGPVG